MLMMTTMTMMMMTPMMEGWDGLPLFARDWQN
jgi:hypothetical protein